MPLHREVGQMSNVESSVAVPVRAPSAPGRIFAPLCIPSNEKPSLSAMRRLASLPPGVRETMRRIRVQRRHNALRAFSASVANPWPWALLRTQTRCRIDDRASRCHEPHQITAVPVAASTPISSMPHAG